MARMFPNAPAEDTRSPAERKLFPRIRDQTPDDWTALHSLGLKGHSRKMWAEADFVIVCSLGVYVLEVKGGSIQRHERQWFQNGKDMGESPFDQGGGAAGALRRDLLDHVPRARGACIAHAVAFPDIEFISDGPDIDRALVYDATDASAPFAAFLERVADFYTATKRRKFRELSRADQSAVVHRLAGDFDLVASLRSQIDELEIELFKMTEHQKAAVAGFAQDPRAVVLGSAGTGKTLLATTEAERLAQKGKRVLLCCLNPRLADRLAVAVADQPEVETVSYHEWQRSLIDAAGKTDELPDARERELYKVFYPALAIDAFGEAEHPPFDALVIDEAQDLMLSTHLEFFDAILDGGLEQGVWRVFLDPFQDIHGGAGNQARQRLEDCARPFRLITNCRNTAPIATAATLLAGRRYESVLSPEGPVVDEHWYNSAKDQRKQLGTRLREWLAGGLRPEEIVVLSTRQVGRSAVRDGLPDGVPATAWDRASGVARGPDGIEVATVGDFKGLEATAVAVLDVDGLADAPERTAAYVAASRATTFLAMFLDSRVEAAYQEAARAFGQRVAAAATREGPAKGVQI